MRYRVRNARGEELVCPSLGDLHALYRQGFLDDDDQVCAERSGTWERLGDFAALRGERSARHEPRRARLLLAIAALAALALWLFFRLR